NNLLITSQQILGLKNSVEWIKSNKRSPFSQNGQGLTHFENIEALPYLLQLLELSYDPEIKLDHKLDRMWGLVVEGLQFLALANKKNFKTVIKEMKLFIKNNNTLDNIEFLNRPIEEIKDKYYKNATENYTFETAKNKMVF
ncbi:MAG TPA: hypothetical protein VK982_13780, partial [Bacteroidales bacterium]|nr:hypothetical protein [Bacteroidales bacterium]